MQDMKGDGIEWEPGLLRNQQFGSEDAAVRQNVGNHQMLTSGTLCLLCGNRTKFRKCKPALMIQLVSVSRRPWYKDVGSHMVVWILVS